MWSSLTVHCRSSSRSHIHQVSRLRRAERASVCLVCVTHQHSCHQVTWAMTLRLHYKSVWCHQLSDFKAKLLQVVFRLGSAPQTLLGSLQYSQAPDLDLRGLLLLRGREVKDSRRKEGKEGAGRECKEGRRAREGLSPF